MKKIYEAPVAAVTVMSAEDIVRTSETATPESGSRNGFFALESEFASWL